MSNKSDGSRFETEFCDLLSQHGYWCHNMAQNQQGQPADVIACKNGRVFLIDCKVCDTDTFNTNRVEPNQESAMRLFEHCGNPQGLFAIKLKSGAIYMLALDDVMLYSPRVGKSTMCKPELGQFGLTLNDWFKQVEFNVSV